MCHEGMGSTRNDMGSTCSSTPALETFTPGAKKVQSLFPCVPAKVDLWENLQLKRDPEIMVLPWFTMVYLYVYLS
jgi:hypothetical protein